MILRHCFLYNNEKIMQINVKEMLYQRKCKS